MTSAHTEYTSNFVFGCSP